MKALLLAFWQQRPERFAWWLLALLVALALGEVWAQYLVSDWQRLLFDAFQQKDVGAFHTQIANGLFVITVFIACQAAKLYVQQWLTIRWREWATRRLLDRWLAVGRANSVLYELERTGAIDNPDQRIADDVRMFVELTLEFGIGLLYATVLFLSFAAVLWRASGTIDVTFAGQTWVVHGHLFWVALAYVVVGNAVTHWVGHRLIPTNERQQQAEADFRYSLTVARENAEAVALARTAEGEQRGMLARFSLLRSNWFRLMRLRLGLGATTGWYEQFSTLLAYLVASPRLFSGAITLGDMVQAATAFGVVRQALSWFIINYPRIADWKASANRLLQLEAAIARAEAPRATGVVNEAHAGASLEARGLTLWRPAVPDGGAGAPLTARFDWTVQPGQRWLVSGPSGAGKTTLLRAAAGVWPDGEGRILQPTQGLTMLVPQRPYFPIGTLREGLAHPQPIEAFTEAALRAALGDCGLAHLGDVLDRSGVRWAQRLSPGELQRLAFARLLLHRPERVFLDEATSALDADFERHMYCLLEDRLPGLTLVSIAHRESVAGFHDHRLHFERGSSGPSVPTVRTVV